MRAIAEVIPIVSDPDAVPPVLAKRLDALQTQISTADESSLRPRWEFGRELVRLRGGKRKLPTGVVHYMEEIHHVAVRELQFRARFAEMFPTEHLLRHAVTQYPSWHAMRNEGLVTTRRKPKAKAETEYARLVRYLERLRASGMSRRSVDRAVHQVFEAAK